MSATPNMSPTEVRLRLPARLTMGSASSELQPLMTATANAGASTVVIDGQGLEQFDSSAIAILLELRRQALERGGRLTVHGLPPRLAELMTLYGVGELLPA